MPIDANGNTFRKIINQAYPDLKIEAFHHAGTSSGNVDGAAALLLASEAYVRKHAPKPPARIIAGAKIGEGPTPMRDAPVPAPRIMQLERASWRDRVCKSA